MNDFIIDQRLRDDCHVLGKLPTCHLLLHRNATLPWLILVPPTTHTELHSLDPATYRAVMDEAAAVGRFLNNHFDLKKINTAAIGNIVRQLHIHVIGRHENDPCWPGVVWGQLEHLAAYSEHSLAEIRGWATTDLSLI